MCRLSTIFVWFLFIVSCNQEEKTDIVPSISEHDKIVSLLSENTWSVDKSSVTRCDETRPEWSESNFRLEFFEHYNDSLSIKFRAVNVPPFDFYEKIWPVSGTLSFEKSRDGLIDYSEFIRDDNVIISTSYDTLNVRISIISMVFVPILENGSSSCDVWSFELMAVD